MKTRVWFNKGFSVIHHVLNAMHATGQWELYATHTTPEAPMLYGPWHHELEPAGLTGRKYLNWALEYCKKHRIEVFFPCKEKSLIKKHEAEFAAIGTTLVVSASPEVLRLVDHKAEFLQTFPTHICPIPDFRTFHTLDEFNQAVEELGGERKALCFKPSVGIYASGFRMLTRKSRMTLLLGNELYAMSYQEARAYFGNNRKFAKMMLMEVCEGTERSIDCVALNGELAQCVIRSKSKEGAQVSEDNAAVEQMAREITRHYGLNGIFNIQLKDRGGVPNMLEINARPSGGMHLSITAGLNFGHVAALMALGHLTPDQVPAPKRNVRMLAIMGSVLVRDDVLEEVH
ncbi:ATP-grasp domain-containing protein [Deinococcus roseus]|uniref:ATP-grasp domain-containing protein n=1 Tax=Deinococcus roseus TaxID=392414 RepID=A0ABQ2D0Q2_9DEIO|nr:ATP-grasp domain-containing protein [Deinococcus roseus]GGJ39302.1 hypothetical protein GCM10008938_26700 [Deinococcus roseus]